MKIAIVQRGPESVGKTTTIRMLYQMLLERYPDAELKHLLDKNADVRAVVMINGVSIGIESQGDPWKKAARLDPSLNLFVRLRCHIIVCASRTYGGTVDSVRGLEDHGYTVAWRARKREAAPAMYQRVNRAEAKWMIEQIESRLPAAALA